MSKRSNLKLFSLPMVIALVLILGGGFCAYMVQTGGGDIDIRDVRFMGSNGTLMSGCRIDNHFIISGYHCAEAQIRGWSMTNFTITRVLQTRTMRLLSVFGLLIGFTVGILLTFDLWDEIGRAHV